MRKLELGWMIWASLAVLACGACASNPGIEADDMGSDAPGSDAGSDASVDGGGDDATLPDGGTCIEPQRVCGSTCATCPENAVVATGCDGTTCVAIECAIGYTISNGACVAIGEVVQEAYVKASNTGTGDAFGWSVAVSSDGNTMAVGAPRESSSATGIDGDQANNDASESGAVYVFIRSATTWVQQAYIKASNTGTSDQFGWAVGLSQDGSTLVVGAPGERSSATGIGGNQADNTADTSGAVYVFTRTGPTWSQQAYVKAVNTGAGDTFGTAVSISNAGSSIAVGAPREDSNGSFADNSLADSGAVYLFSRSGVTWTQEAYLKAPNHEAADFFGIAVRLSGDGATVAIGATVEASSATGVDGDASNNDYPVAGAAYVFTRNPDESWSFEAYIKASNTDPNDVFGQALALSVDGNMLAVGAAGEQSGGDGVGSDQTNNSANQSGAVYIFTRTGSAWAQEAYLKAEHSDAFDQFGQALAFNDAGNILLVGAAEESGGIAGVGGDQTDNTLSMSGAAFMFARDGASWSQRSYIKASNPNRYDDFGQALAMSNDGRTIAIAAVGEAIAATGIGGLELDNSFSQSGAVYIFGY